MAVHMVRLFLEQPKGEVESAVDNWVKNHTEWTNDPVSHLLTETNTQIDGSGTQYVRGDYRFIQEETADSLLDDLESRLQSIQGGLWYRIGYHTCTHDQDKADQTACSWDQTRENGTIPSDVPVLT